MPYRIFVRKEAEQDIRDSLLYYKRINPKLGYDFIQRIDEAIAKSAHRPFQYQLVYRDIRRVLLKQFPVGLYFKIHDDQIIVLAVLNSRHAPKNWIDRN